MKMGLPVILAFVLGSLSFAYAHGYPKLSMPRNEIAVLTNPKDSPIEVMRIDGKPVGFSTHGEFELLPGRHFLSVEMLFIKHHVQYGSQILDIVFDAKPGCDMKVGCLHHETEFALKKRGETDNKSSFDVWVEESLSGRKISSYVDHWGEWKVWFQDQKNKVLNLEIENLNDALVETILKQDKLIQGVKKIGIEELVFLDKVSAAVWRAKLQEGRLELYSKPN